MYSYLISGLVVRSCVELPSAFLLVDREQPTEVVIEEGVVPEALECPVREGRDWQRTAHSFLFRVPGTARFLVENGDSIRFEADAGHDPGDLRLYLLGTCLAVLLQQRGSLVLHASGVAVGSRAMLFCGASGAGKSTMAALLCRAGFPLLNDDTCRLTRDQQGRYAVRADGRMLKLWSHSLEHCAGQGEQGPAVRKLTEKFYVRPASSDAEPRELGGVYLLAECGADEAPSIERLSRVKGMMALRQNAFRPALVDAMDLEADFFEASAAMQRSAGIYVLRRPKVFGLAGELVAMLRNHWERELGG
jgi:hypothetical protein